MASFYIPDVASFNLVAHSHTITIVNLYVVPACRRQGIATGLFKHIENGARKAGFTLLGLSVFTNRPDSPGGISFAESLGLRIYDAGSVLDLKSYFKPLKAVIQPVPTPTEIFHAKETQA